MAYIDQAYLERRVGPAALSGTVSAHNTPASMTASVISEALEEASSWVDTWFAPWYPSLPLSSPDSVIKALTADYAYYNLCIRDTGTAPQGIVDRVRDGTAYLGELKNNAIKLVNAETSNETDPAGHVFASTSGSLGTKFQIENLRGKMF